MFAIFFTRNTSDDCRKIISSSQLADSFPRGMPSDVTGQWSGKTAVMAGAFMWNTPESRLESVPEVCPETGRIIMAWVRLDNRAEICSKLEITELETLTDPQIILKAHQKFGAECVKLFDGDFSFFIIDPKTHECFCARDILGAKPFYYVLTEGLFIAASSVAVIKNIALAKQSVLPKLTPCKNWAVNYMAQISFDLTDTAYEEIKRLPPAHVMTIKSGQVPSIQKYFTYDTQAPHADRIDPKWVAPYAAAFDRAVKVRARSAYLVGCEYSGGLDSTSILSYLVEHLPHAREELHCFADCSLEKEPDLLLHPIMEFNVRNTHVLTRPMRLTTGPDYQKSLDVIGYPLEHTQVLMHLPFLEMAQKFGVRTLLSGYGGDEIVTHRADMAIWDLRDNRAFRAIFDMTAGSLLRRIVRFAKHLMRQKSDQATELAKFLHDDIALIPFKKNVAEYYGIDIRINSLMDALRQSQTQSEYHVNTPFFSIAPMVRLESYTLMARQYGIEYRWPLLDRTLIQTHLQTPSIEKRYRQWGRYLHRRAMDGRVPDIINWYPRKYLGEPVGFKTSIALADKTAALDLPVIMQDMIEPAALSEFYDKVSANVEGGKTNRDSMITLLLLTHIIRIKIWFSKEDN